MDTAVTMVFIAFMGSVIAIIGVGGWFAGEWPLVALGAGGCALCIFFIFAMIITVRRG